MADLSAVNTSKKSNDGVWMQIKDLDGNVLANDEGQEMAILVYGKDSARYRKFISDAFKANAGRKTERTFEELEASNIELLSDMIGGFRNIVLGGEPLEYTKEAAKSLMADFPVIREQVDTFVGSRANFLLNA